LEELDFKRHTRPMPTEKHVFHTTGTMETHPTITSYMYNLKPCMFFVTCLSTKTLTVMTMMTVTISQRLSEWRLET